LERKTALFGQHNLRDLYFFGPHKDLIGSSVDTLPQQADISNAGIVRLNTKLPEKSTKVHMPSYLMGELTSIDPDFRPDELKLAIAINGIIRGTTESSVKDEQVTFAARIPIESWSEGKNAVSVYGIIEDENGDGVSLVRFTEKEEGS
jgi:hypothetical protein